MQADIKLKKSITVHLSQIDLMNLKQGIPIKAGVKALNQELEIPYEITVIVDGEEKNYTSE